ncbi:MAG: peptidase family [Myxococcales bacterium]|nr:peptidase family [Myxococcales bacterium]
MTRFISLAALLALTSVAIADPKVTVQPATVHPGDPVLVTVTGVKTAPKGKALGTPLRFFNAKRGYQAVFAVPLDTKPEIITIDLEGPAKAVSLEVDDLTFPETSIVVEDELANPDKADRDRIDSDNKAIIDAALESKDQPLFTRPFRRPPGEVTSTFGEWRTFNDGHKSQHLGLDLFAKEGSKVKAINAGTVVLVRDSFLAGNLVVIAHGAGIASAYYHLSKVLVAEGERVEQGAELGLAGHTGRTTGPHLHLSVRVPGGFIDPAAFFRLALAPTTLANAREDQTKRPRRSGLER